MHVGSRDKANVMADAKTLAQFYLSEASRLASAATILLAAMRLDAASQTVEGIFGGIRFA